MPKTLLDFMGYCFYFFSNESNEPIHIHVSKGAPSEINAKFWINGDDVILAHNKAQIPQNDLNRIKKYISLNKKDVVFAWYKHFGTRHG